MKSRLFPSFNEGKDLYGRRYARSMLSDDGLLKTLRRKDDEN